MIILSHPTGNANVKTVATNLAERQLLTRFYTSIATYPGNKWYRLGKLNHLAEFRRRSFDPVLQPSTSEIPFRELGRLLAIKMNWKAFLEHEKGYLCIDEIYRSFDKQVSKTLALHHKNGARAVYAYEDGALETFRTARKLHMKCIYDLPIAYWETSRQLLKEEAERLPQWACTLGGGIKDSAAKLERKQSELELADVVVGPGSFVMDSLPSWAQDKMKIVSPFGSPSESGNEMSKTKKNPGANLPLKVLFVGSMGQRKGLGDLFEAMKLLNNPNFELVVLGSLLAPMEFYRKEFPDFQFEQGRSHDEVLQFMRTCDVFCLPSIVEGRALVIQEAMSQGLPIIITTNTGGEDLVREGKTGFLVPLRSPEKIAEKLQWFLDNRILLPEMSKNARELSQTYTWKNYSNNIINELMPFLETKKVLSSL